MGYTIKSWNQHLRVMVPCKKWLVKYKLLYTRTSWTSYFLQGTRNTRPSLIGHLQCDAISWEQFLRRGRLGQLRQDISGRRKHFRPNIWNQICSEYHLTKMLTNITGALNLNFIEFHVVMCCISLNMHFLQSVFKKKITIEIPEDMLSICFI